MSDNTDLAARSGFYLAYKNFCKTGIDHAKGSLRWCLLEAAELRRGCVIPALNLDYQIHNGGNALTRSWADYIDFDKTELPVGTQFITEAQLVAEQIPQSAELTMPREAAVTQEQNLTYRLVTRDLKFYDRALRRLNLVSAADPPHVAFYPTAQIISAARAVLRQLPAKFCAVSVRTDDAHVPAHLSRNADLLNPSFLSRRIAELNPEQLPVFLMSKTADASRFEPLQQQFTLYRHFDFAELQHAEYAADNFLLYEVEKLIFLNANIHIYTYKNDWCELSLLDLKRNAQRWQTTTPRQLWQAQALRT